MARSLSEIANDLDAIARTMNEIGRAQMLYYAQQSGMDASEMGDIANVRQQIELPGGRRLTLEQLAAEIREHESEAR